MKVLETSRKILRNSYVCDHCLGRQFSEILSGYSNRERGYIIRHFLAMEYDSRPFRADKRNFHGIGFRKRKLKPPKPGKCSVCRGLFRELEKYAKIVVKKMKGMDFETFLVGSKMSDSLVIREESLWERVGIEHCESLRREVNRELGKMIESMTGKEAEEKRPDVNVLLNLQKKGVEIRSNPLYVYGKYKKLVRGIPQTKWEKYRTTVEDIIARPFMKKTKGSGHALHACGREDIDARCMGWRPFVLEIDDPVKRMPDLKRMRREINRTGKVRVTDLRFSDRKEVVRVKSIQPDKVYRVVVTFEEPVENMENIKKAAGTIHQKTPRRVLHRRANRTRDKKVKSIKWTKINKRKYKIVIHTEAGVYVKEFVSGDGGRTMPSVSSVLGNKAETESLDVIEVMVK